MSAELERRAQGLVKESLFVHGRRLNAAHYFWVAGNGAEALKQMELAARWRKRHPVLGWFMDRTCTSATVDRMARHGREADVPAMRREVIRQADAREWLDAAKRNAQAMPLLMRDIAQSDWMRKFLQAAARKQDAERNGDLPTSARLARLTAIRSHLAWARDKPANLPKERQEFHLLECLNHEQAYWNTRLPEEEVDRLLRLKPDALKRASDDLSDTGMEDAIEKTAAEHFHLETSLQLKELAIKRGVAPADAGKIVSYLMMGGNASGLQNLTEAIFIQRLHPAA